MSNFGGVLDVRKSCRTCMKVNDTVIDLFESFKTEIDNSVQLVAMLAVCTEVKVDKKDGLPQGICGDCVKTLQVSYSFRNQAQNVQQTFKDILSSVKEEHHTSESFINDACDFNFGDELFDATCNMKVETEDLYSEQKFDTNKKVKRKKLKKHLNGSFPCTLCRKQYSKKLSLEKHMMKYHPESGSTIITNPEEFFHEVGLSSLVVLPSVKKEEVEDFPEQLKCPKCDLFFTKGRSLAMHMKKHKVRKDEGVFECDCCGKQFNTRGGIRRHMKSHEMGKQFQCGLCPKKFYRGDLLKFHMDKHNGIKSYKCPFCNKAFIQKCNLKDHMRIHTGETPFLCPECGKGFNNQSNLRQHLVRHAGIKSFSCILCPKKFVTKGQLTTHIQSHTGEHPYKCELCAAAFTKSTSLKKHTLIHAGVRPFACDADGCKMKFLTKDHLKRHSRIHTGEKPYRCQYCARAFTQSNDLNKHLRTHVGQNIYQCTMCTMRFRLVSELKQHYPSHFTNGDRVDIPPDKVIEDFNKCIAQPPGGARDETDTTLTAEPQNVITIKFNRNINDKSGFAGDITIDITPSNDADKILQH